MKRSGLKPYEWMVKYTPEEAWIRGEGVLLWLAFFLTEIGAGVYFVSLFMNFGAGWVVGWLLTLIPGGLVHLSYLGKPMRSWRILLRPVTSELSRGLWVILAYGVVGFFQVLPVVFPALPWDGQGTILKTVMGVLCILLIAHGFMMMSVVRALPFWNSSMMVPLSVASGLCVGSQAVLAMMMVGSVDLHGVELWARWSLLTYIALLGLQLWGAGHSSEAARASLRRMTAGEASRGFYLGVIGLGIVIPLAITLRVWTGSVESTSPVLLALRFVCVVAGDLMMRHNILGSGLYTPLIPRRVHRRA